MTRFARAKGSKASNERVPEEATSWTDMKEQVAVKKDADFKKNKREEVEQTRLQNYEKFLKEEVKEEATQEWCEFSDEEKMNKHEKSSLVKNGKISKKNKSVKRKNYVLLPKPDSNADSDEAPEEVSVSKIDTALSKKKQKQSKKGLKSQLSSNTKNPIEEQKPDITKIYNKKGQLIKKKTAKVRDNKEHKSRKPNKGCDKIFSNGRYIEVMKFDGFPIMKADHERLTELKKSMISKGISKTEVKLTMLKERRKAEKAFAREKKKVCFQCRRSGHVLSECPNVGLDNLGIQTSGTGMCFKCGSTEHTHFECKVVRSQEFKFAECFICKEKGHIARQCPDNPRGLYPKGGSCRLCGSVTHLKKDCPQSQQENEEKIITIPTNVDSVEGLENETKPIVKVENTNQNIVKF